MSTGHKSILFVADQPWQIRIFATAVEVLAVVSPEKRCEILISDYYTFLHQKNLMLELDLKNIKYRSMASLFETWQDDSDPAESTAQRKLLENILGDAQLMDRLEKTNPWIYGDERNSYYLPMSDPWKEKIFLDTLRWCVDSLVDFSPQLIVSIERSTLPNNAIYEISRRMNIPHRCFIPSRIDNYWYVRNDFGRSIGTEFAKDVTSQDYSAQVVSQVNSWVEKFLELKRGSYRSLEEVMIRNLPKGRVSDAVEYFREIIALLKKAYARIFERKHFGFKIRRLEQDLLKLTYIQFRQFALKTLFSLRFWKPFDHFDGHDQYFLWALHARPEGSVLALNNGRDELEQLKDFSLALPKGAILLVKENIEMLGLRQKGFYKSLSSHHNIQLLSPDVNLANLIPGCVGIVGISGTFLLEGALYGKPVFALGDPEFKFFLSNRSFPMIEDFITAVLTSQITVDIEPVKKYIAYIFEFGFDFGHSLFDNEATKPQSRIVREIINLVNN